MIKISDIAVDRAKEILTAEGKPGWGLRVYMADSDGGSSPSYGMDIDEQPAEGDEILEKNGLKVFMDKVTYYNLSGMEIDFIDNGEQKGFILTGGESSSCSTCGGC